MGHYCSGHNDSSLYQTMKSLCSWTYYSCCSYSDALVVVVTKCGTTFPTRLAYPLFVDQPWILLSFSIRICRFHAHETIWLCFTWPGKIGCKREGRGGDWISRGLYKANWHMTTPSSRRTPLFSSEKQTLCDTFPFFAVASRDDIDKAVTKRKTFIAPPPLKPHDLQTLSNILWNKFNLTENEYFKTTEGAEDRNMATHGGIHLEDSLPRGEIAKGVQGGASRSISHADTQSIQAYLTKWIPYRHLPSITDAAYCIRYTRGHWSAASESSESFPYSVAPVWTKLFFAREARSTNNMLQRLWISPGERLYFGLQSPILAYRGQNIVCPSFLLLQRLWDPEVKCFFKGRNPLSVTFWYFYSFPGSYYYFFINPLHRQVYGMMMHVQVHTLNLAEVPNALRKNSQQQPDARDGG